jgi:hypothetical protein
MLSLPRKRRQVLGAGLNRSEIVGREERSRSGSRGHLQTEVAGGAYAALCPCTLISACLQREQ